MSVCMLGRAACLVGPSGGILPSHPNLVPDNLRLLEEIKVYKTLFIPILKFCWSHWQMNYASLYLVCAHSMTEVLCAVFVMVGQNIILQNSWIG